MASRSPVAPPASPEALVERCLNHDEAAWERIVRQYWRKVFHLAYKFVGTHDEAEDLAQEIFLRLYRTLHTFDRRANFETWLVTVSRNLCIDHYRSARRERETVTREVDAREVTTAVAATDPLSELERHDQVALLKRALDRLPAALKAAVVLCDLQELSYQEIARQLNLPEGTVKSRIHRGRAALRRQLRRLLDPQPTNPEPVASPPRSGAKR
jgi:RNA polymerase sigma-70 factor (ECF subfamily)